MGRICLQVMPTKLLSFFNTWWRWISWNLLPIPIDISTWTATFNAYCVMLHRKKTASLDGNVVCNTECVVGVGGSPRYLCQRLGSNTLKKIYSFSWNRKYRRCPSIGSVAVSLSICIMIIYSVEVPSSQFTYQRIMRALSLHYLTLYVECLPALGLVRWS